MIIYKATNKINRKSYVGQTRLSLKQRKRLHIDHAKKKLFKSYFHNAIRKYGEKNFVWEVLISVKDRDELMNFERHYIKSLNTKIPKGYNLTDGGECLIGDKNPMFGKKQSEKCKRINREMRLGKKQSKALVEKRISKIRGKNHYFNNGSKRGKEIREEHSQRWDKNNPFRKTWILISPVGEMLMIRKLKTFCEERGFSYNSMRGALPKYGHSNGYKFINKVKI